MSDPEKGHDPRVRTRAIAADFASRGDATGWFEALYKESGGNTALIPWADLEANRFLREWAVDTKLEGNGRSALVVGCGLGDDAAFLDERGFDVTAFDISPTAIEWARRLHTATPIRFVIADLFDPPAEWYQAFEFVLEIYTIQPLPLNIRPQVIDAISNFVGFGGELLVVARGRGDDERPEELPWPLSKADLSRFRANGLKEKAFSEILDTSGETPVSRFIVEYSRPGGAGPKVIRK